MFGVNTRIEVYADTLEFDLPFEIPQGFVKLFLAGHTLGHVELAADPIRGIKQRHLVPPPGGNSGKGQSRGAGSYHGQGGRCLGLEEGTGG